MVSARKEEEIPMKSSPISLITVAPDENSENEARKKMKGSEEDSEERNSTFAPDVSENCCLEKQVEIYQKEIVDEEDSELEEEEEQTTSSTTTTTTTTTTTEEPSTTSEYRKKSKKNRRVKL